MDSRKGPCIDSSKSFPSTINRSGSIYGGGGLHTDVELLIVGLAVCGKKLAYIGEMDSRF